MTVIGIDNRSWFRAASVCQTLDPRPAINSVILNLFQNLDVSFQSPIVFSDNGEPFFSLSCIYLQYP